MLCFSQELAVSSIINTQERKAMSWVEEGLVLNLQDLVACVLSHSGRVQLFATL